MNEQQRLSHLLSLSQILASALPKSAEVCLNDFGEHVIHSLNQCIDADAIVILMNQDNTLVPLACSGLTPDAIGRRFKVVEHPRFVDITKEPFQPVIFPAECEFPDPYDGMLMAESGNLPVHACMGFALTRGSQVLGVVTFDSLSPHAFTQYPLSSLKIIQSLVSDHFSAVLNMADLAKRAKSGMAMLHELSTESYDMVGESPCMLQLKADIQLVADSDLSVLIEGETGTGKELVARQVHSYSSRHQAPFVQVNCASLPEHLAESEFFGHRKGAFTGANTHREGKFLIADKGTLFLDEIGELPLEMQSKLLRVLQSGEIQPVGSDHTQYVNVRVVAATNRDLQKEVEAGRFRADLYHRLSVFPVHVPPLNQRGEDIVLLAGFFVEKLRKKLGVSQLLLDKSLLKVLKLHDWPGNVRELEHVLSRSALKAKRKHWDKEFITIRPVDCELAFESQQEVIQPISKVVKSDSSGNLSIKVATEQFQKQLIEHALQLNNFNWAATARELQTDRANLVRLAKRLGIMISKSLN